MSSSKERRAALRPKTDTIWAWEPYKAAASEIVVVNEVFWNGERWMVTIGPAEKRLLEKSATSDDHFTCDVSRFWEAVHAIRQTPGP